MDRKEDMSYIAGLMDGDGSFTVIKQSRHCYRCRITLSNVFEGMPRLLAELFGGHFGIVKLQSHSKKQQYRWAISSKKDCLDFLNRVAPYLKLKKIRAEYMKEFIQSFIGRDRKIIQETSEVLDAERAHLKMQTYNLDCVRAPIKMVKSSTSISADPVFWSYFAGLMDTDGSFSIKKEKAHSGSVSIRYNPMIQIAMCTADCINFVRHNFPFGNFCIPKAKGTSRGFAYKMSLSSKRECILFLSNIIPYLRFKKDRALLLLEFCNNFCSTKERRGGVPESVLSYRGECYKKMISLNG